MERRELPQPSIDEVRRKYGGPAMSDEEFLLRFFAGPEFVDAMKLAPPRKEYLAVRQPLEPLVRLVEELGRRRDFTQVHIQKGNLSVSIKRKA